MKKVVAVVTDTGGSTSHAAIVSRELGIPCVVGTGRATSVLKNGQMVTVDGEQGVVYKGLQPQTTQKKTETTEKKTEVAPVTATKIYVNLGEPSISSEVAKEPCDGVGLLRAEFMIAEIGEHPKYMISQGRGKEFAKKLSEGIKTIAQAFYPRPVVYRATDFKTNEYKGLKGGEKYEPTESNPMLGFRGAFRYIAEPEVFKLELWALRRVREQFGFNNLWLMIPFVRTVEELQKIQAILEEEGMVQTHDFKLWMMVEVPSNVFLIDKFCTSGIDGVSIGSNDLTQLILGVDRDNEKLAGEFNERNEAVTMAIKHVIETCRKYNVTSSLCGQAPSVYPEFVELLVEAGITSISVNPDAIFETKKLVASIEKRILLDKIKEIEGLV
jgi:pyruvate,water dikinase